MDCCCYTSGPCAGKIGIFAHLDPESQQKVSDLASHLTFQKGEILFSPESSAGLYLISQGRVKVYELSPSGRELLLRVLHQGDFVGEEALFQSAPSYTFGEALTEVRACFIPRQAFLDLLMQYPSISLKLLEEFSSRISRAGHQIAANTAEPVAVRLAGYLLELAVAQEQDQVILPLSMRELAAFLSTTPETLSRRMAWLEEQGLVRKKGRRITVLNRAGLQKVKA